MVAAERAEGDARATRATHISAYTFSACFQGDCEIRQIQTAGFAPPPARAACRHHNSNGNSTQLTLAALVLLRRTCKAP